jgi:hypothetical protein
MDSINRNQPEENRDNLQAQEAIEKIKELVEKGQIEGKLKVTTASKG